MRLRGRCSLWLRVAALIRRGSLRRFRAGIVGRRGVGIGYAGSSARLRLAERAPAIQVLGERGAGQRKHRGYRYERTLHCCHLLMIPFVYLPLMAIVSVFLFNCVSRFARSEGRFAEDSVDRTAKSAART